jgi:thioesterase domain-containing protein
LLVLARGEADAAEAESAWRALELPDFEIVACDGDHQTLLAEPDVAALAARLPDKLSARVPQSGVR